MYCHVQIITKPGVISATLSLYWLGSGVLISHPRLVNPTIGPFMVKVEQIFFFIGRPSFLEKVLEINFEPKGYRVKYS